MDYSELVKSLRICVNGTTCLGCIKNADGTEYGCKPLGDIELVREAADTIEELEAVCKKQEVDLVEMTGELASKPKWIPVTERLPKYGERVLVFGGFTMYVAYYDKNRYGGESWHKLNSKSHYCNPTHWMPLPEPPKEET